MNDVSEDDRMPVSVGSLEINNEVIQAIGQHAAAPGELGDGYHIGVLGSAVSGYASGDYLVWQEGVRTAAVYPGAEFKAYLAHISMDPFAAPVPKPETDHDHTEDKVAEEEEAAQKKRKQVEEANEQQRMQEQTSRVGGVGALLLHLAHKAKETVLEAGDRAGFVQDLEQTARALDQFTHAHAAYAHALGPDVVNTLAEARSMGGDLSELSASLNGNPAYEEMRSKFMSAMNACPDTVMDFQSAQTEFARSIDKLMEAVASGNVPNAYMQPLTEFLGIASLNGSKLDLPIPGKDADGRSIIDFEEMAEKVKQVTEAILAKLGLGGPSPT